MSFDEFYEFRYENFEEYLNYNYGGDLTGLFGEQLIKLIGELRSKILFLKKEYDKDEKEQEELYKIAGEAGYFYCNCCNHWKKPLPQ